MPVLTVRPSPNSETSAQKLGYNDESLAPRNASLHWLRPKAIEYLTLCIDLVIVVLSGMSCSVVYHLISGATVGKVSVYAAASTLVAANFGLLMTVRGSYSLKAITDLPRAFRKTLTTWTGVFGALLAAAFTMKASDEFSRGTTISFYLVGLTSLLIWRSALARWIAIALRTGAFANSRSIMIAEHGLAGSFNAPLVLAEHGYRVTRILEIHQKELASPLLLSTVASRIDELIAYAREHQIEHVFLLISWNRQHAIDSILSALKILPIPVHLMPDTHAARFLKYPLINVGHIWTAELRRAPLSWKERSVKRALDLVGACLALVAFAPVMLITAILVKATSPGPVFFRQTRNGFGGKTFKIVKFRTMRVLEDGTTIVQAKRNDPRVTAVGKWLRKTSVDELPQLLNVLNGDMSLVGPRPHAAAHNTEYERAIGNYAFRHHVKPGITGWAQVNGYRGETSTLELMEKRVEHDIWYINNWSVTLDLKILFLTILTSHRSPNAY